MNTIIYNCKIIWVSIILFLATCPVNGQVKKTKQLTVDDYALWSTLKAESISDHGHWVSYSLSYESGLDTLFVKSASTEKTFAFPKGHDGKFLTDTSYGCILSGNRFQLLNLLNGKIQEFENVQEFSQSGQYVIFYCNDTNGKMKIVIRNLKGEMTESVNNVTSYCLSPKENILAYCTSGQRDNSVTLLQFGKKISRTAVIQSAEKAFENIIWQENGKSIAFVGRPLTAKPFTADTVLFYNMESKQLFQYDTTIEKNWSTDTMLAANYTASLGISNDGTKVFFMTNKKPSENKVRNDLEVQVWNAADRELFALQNKYGSVQDNPRLVCWELKNNSILQIGDDIHPASMLSGNQEFALVYHPDDNKPSFKQETDKNYYLLDLKTSKKTLFLKQQSGSLGSLFFSPKGNYVVYFKECNWWIYSFGAQTHRNLTLKTGVLFYDNFNDKPQEPSPYGYVGFTADDKSVLLYDQFDLWQFNADFKDAKRLTNGRENKQVFRLADNEKGNIDNIVFNDKTININSNFLLKAQAIDNSKSGYFNLDKKQQLHCIAYDPKLVSSLNKAKDVDSFMYVQEDFNQPPTLIVKKKNGSAKSIYKSNPQYNHYGWSTSRLIAYKDSKGNDLNGVLFYPFDYDPNRRYPMVVYIYEKQTKALHTYTNPSLLNGSSFNPTNYTSEGYFVLFPDIKYEIGNPGFSAVDCVIAATHMAIESASIDKTKIGLMGHSFGAYETNFIITQTDLFAAAVAGAGVSDLSSCYLSVGWADLKPNARRFEYDQMRMGKTLFDNYGGYQRNSPINYVANVTTPLLSYTGGDDKQVNPYQTMEFYLALRRLKKKHIMLIYPKENHVIQKSDNQIDLTKKIAQWFGHFLKGDTKPQWFESH